MTTFTNSDVTAGPTPAIHAGLNYKHSTYTLAETASGALTIAMCNLPGGARVADITVGLDNASMGLGATPGTLVAYVSTGGTNSATLIQSATVSTVTHVYNPVYEAIGYRCTSSSQVHLTFNNLPASGTAQTIISVAVAYDCGLDPD